MMTPSEISRELCKPFGSDEIQFKPQAVSGNRAMAVAYVSARVVMDRLDDVLGLGGWQDDYEFLPSGSVVCRLRINLGGEWISKTDVGSPSEQPDDGDKLKAAVSDALKRAAVKLGIGRYLYRFPSQWVDYDPQKRKFTAQPVIPVWARTDQQRQLEAPRKTSSSPTSSQQSSSRDPAEVIGEDERRRLVQFLANANPPRPWERASTWLAGQDPSWKPDGKINDLTFAQYWIMLRALGVEK